MFAEGDSQGTASGYWDYVIVKLMPNMVAVHDSSSNPFVAFQPISCFFVAGLRGFEPGC